MIKDLSDKQHECLKLIAENMQRLKRSGFTGKDIYELHYNDGGLSVVYNDSRKIVITNKIRKVRSKGI